MARLGYFVPIQLFVGGEIMNVTRSRVALFLLFFLISLVFYWFNVVTPMRVDDYLMSSKVTEIAIDGNFATEKISNCQEYFQAIAGRWMFWNGRLSDDIGSAIYVLGNGKTLFNVLNPLILCASILAVAFFSFGKINITGSSVSLLALLLFLPNLGGVLLWASGAVNYLWSLCALMLVLLAAEKMAGRQDMSGRYCVLVYIAAFICGAWHEALGASLLGALVLYWCMERWRGRHMTNAYVMLVLVTVLGCIFPMSSPAMWERAAEVAPETKCNVLLWSILGSWTGMLMWVPIPLFMTIFLICRNPRSLFSPLGAFIITNVAIASVIGAKGGWGGGYFFLSVGLTLYILRAFCNTFNSHSRIATSVSVAGSLFIALCGIPQARSIEEAYRKVMDAPKEGANPVVADVSMWKGDIPFLFRYTFSVAVNDYLYGRVGKWHGQPAFCVVYKWFPTDNSRFQAFQDEPVDAFLIKYINGYYVVRLAESCVPAWSMNAHDADGCELVLSGRLWRDRQKLSAFFSNQRLGNFDTECHEGSYYLILPPELMDYEKLRVNFWRQGKLLSEDLAIPRASE